MNGNEYIVVAIFEGGRTECVSSIMYEQDEAFTFANRLRLQSAIIHVVELNDITKVHK